MLAGIALVSGILAWLIFSNLNRISGNAVFIAAVLAELVVIALFYLNEIEYIEISYLWLNLIGCTLVVLIAGVLQLLLGRNEGLVQEAY
ncbi:MAG: hypothetical protein AAFO94_20890, partial [Bacteroidota bacterium]